MKSWNEIWDKVEQALIKSNNRTAALGSVREIRGGPTTWDALARAGRRRGVSVSELFCSGESNLPNTLPINSGFLEDHPVGKKHMVIPDTQCKQGVPLDHLSWIGKYAVAKRPHTIVFLGDHWDMPSLSVYESSTKKASKGIHKMGDIAAGNRALELFEEELAKAPGYNPQRILLEGNHDGFAPGGRVGRYLSDHPEDEGLITPDQFADSWLGYTRVPFQDSIEVDGIRYAHLFPYSTRGTVTATSGRYGAANAAAQLQALMQSCTAGHKQGLDTAIHNTPLRTYRSIIAGSCYQHDEEYLGPGNNYWRGILMKHDVSETNPDHYDLMEVSLRFLKRRFG
jgi:hypothetical protein